MTRWIKCDYCENGKITPNSHLSGTLEIYGRTCPVCKGKSRYIISELWPTSLTLRYDDYLFDATSLTRDESIKFRLKVERNAVFPGDDLATAERAERRWQLYLERKGFSRMATVSESTD